MKTLEKYVKDLPYGAKQSTKCSLSQKRNDFCEVLLELGMRWSSCVETFGTIWIGQEMPDCTQLERATIVYVAKDRIFFARFRFLLRVSPRFVDVRQNATIT